MVKLLLIFCFLAPSFSNAQKSKVVYRYKKYEKFYLDDLDVSKGYTPSGAIDISERYRRKFQNKLPEKPNFNLELIRGMQTIK